MQARDKLHAVEEELAQLRRQLSHRGAGSRSSQLTELANNVKRAQSRITSLKPHIAVHKERITVATTRLQAAQARLDGLAPKLEKVGGGVRRLDGDADTVCVSPCAACGGAWNARRHKTLHAKVKSSTPVRESSSA